MLRQVFFFAVVSLIQCYYVVFSVLVPESSNCVALYRCPELLTTFKNDERLISLKDFLAEHSCSGSVFPPSKVHCENPQDEIQISSFQDVAVQPVNVSVSQVSQDLWPLCDCGYSPKYNQSLRSRSSKAEEGFFPWMVQIYYTEYNCTNSKCDSITEFENITVCGGSIITKRHVLTAAHCVTEKTRRAKELKVVLLGTVKKEHRVHDIKVSMVYFHPKYEVKDTRNDVAILYLAEDIKMSDNVRPVCLHSGPIYYNTRLVSAGWGLTKSGNFSDDLLYVDDQVVWDRDVCNLTYVKEITEDMLCTKGLSGASVCKGDSGGPLMGTTDPHPSCPQSSNTKSWAVLGVTSFGSKVCQAEKPVVFAHVAHFLPWIKDTVERARLTPNQTAELFSKITSK